MLVASDAAGASVGARAGARGARPSYGLMASDAELRMLLDRVREAALSQTIAWQAAANAAGSGEGSGGRPGTWGGVAAI